jgi:hypothetical protein
LPAHTADTEWELLLARTWPNGPQDLRAPVDLTPLHTYVRAIVGAAKARGEPSERVILQLKLLTANGIHRLAPRPQHHALHDRVFQWCLEEYYGRSAGELPSRADEEAGPAAAQGAGSSR